MTQLLLDISLPPSYREEDFLVSACNETAWLALQKWDTPPCPPAALIRGAAASGKTHLAHLWAQRHHALFLSAAHLNAEAAPQSLFHGRLALVLEDIQQIHHQPALFHLLNFVRQSSLAHRLLLTVRSDACWQGFSLPDLRSRLQALPQAEILYPDEDLLRALLVKSFHDRQIDLSTASLDYLLPRIERSFEGVRQAVERIDYYALVKKRPVNRVLIQEVLTIS